MEMAIQTKAMLGPSDTVVLLDFPTVESYHGIHG